MNQLITNTQLEAVFLAFAPRAIQIVNRGDECQPQMFLVKLMPDELVAKAVEAGVMPKVPPGALVGAFDISPVPAMLTLLLHAVAGEDMLKECIQDSFNKEVADIVVHVFESRPDNKDGLVVAVHTPERSYASFMPIEGTGDARHTELIPLDFTNPFELGTKLTPPYGTLLH